MIRCTLRKPKPHWMGIWVLKMLPFSFGLHLKRELICSELRKDFENLN